MLSGYGKFARMATQLRNLMLRNRHAIERVVLEDGDDETCNLMVVKKNVGWLLLQEHQTLVAEIPALEREQMGVLADYMNEVLAEAATYDAPEGQRVFVAEDFARELASVDRFWRSAMFQLA
jgi:hypothetical protein